jgi:hypothetical protein
LTFQREDNAIKLQQQKIATEQQKLLLEQSKLTNKAEIESKKVNAELLKLNYSIQKSTADFEIKKAGLDVRQTELENKIKLSELDYLGQSTINAEFEDSVTKLASAPSGWTDYHVNQIFKVRNTSKNRVDLFEANVEIYLGEEVKEPEYEHAILVNGVDRSGAIKWHLEDSYTYISLERYQEMQSQIPNYRYNLVGGPAIGRLQSGESSFNNQQMKIRIKNRKWICSRLTLQIKEGKNKWQWVYSDYKPFEK